MKTNDFLNGVLFSILLVGNVDFITGQNLVPNPGFEVYTSCPVGIGSGILECDPWLSFAGTVDYFNTCNSGSVGVPTNFQGYQPAHGGNGYVGAYFKTASFTYREYPSVVLLSPLDAGVAYTISFYINNANTSCGVDHVGAYVSEFPPSVTGGYIDVDPQVSGPIQYYSDTVEWILICGSFIAEGGEQYITLGNFFSDAETSWDTLCQPDPPLSYYYFDDVSLVEGDPDGLELELGDPVEACDFYIIDPGLPDLFYNWEDGSHGPTLTVTTSGTYSLTVSSGCEIAIDSIEVTIYAFDPVDIGPEELILCVGDSYVVSLDPDIGEYEWSDGSTESEYIITTPGTYQVTMDDGCELTTDEIVVTSLDVPDPFSLGDDIHICPGGEIEFYFDPGLGDFLWQDNNTSNNYIIYQEGTYELTISNMCGEQTDEIEIVLIEPPFVYLGPDDVILCENDIIDIELDPTEAVYIWQDGNNSNFYTITSAGVYSVTATNVCGSDIAEITVLHIDAPHVDFADNPTACLGDTLVLDGNNSSGNYQWQDGSNATSFVVTTSGTYALTVTNFCGFDSDNVFVNFSPLVLPPALGPDLNLCPGEEFVFHVGTPGANYLWQDLSTSDSLLVASAGTYYVQVSNNCSSASDTVMITLDDQPPQIDLPAQLFLCQGDSISLDAGVSGVSYLWNDGSINAQLQVANPGIYSLTVSNTCGSDNDTIVVSDGGAPPVVSLGNDLELCPGESILLSPTFSNVNGWLWQDGSVLSSYNIINAGQITVQVNNGCGEAFDTIQVSSLPATPLLDLGADTSLCPGESLILSISTPDVQILWPDGSSNSDYPISGAGIFFASISNVCGSSFDTILIDQLPDAPLLDLGLDQSLCPGEVITITPAISNVAYLWQDGSTNSFYQSTQQEIIILTIANDCGSAIDTLEIFESTEGPQIHLGEDILACEGEVITLASGISGVDYLWQDGSTDADYITGVSGTFILQVNNLCGTDSDTIVVDISGVPPVTALGTDTTLCEGTDLILYSTADAETAVLWQDGSTQPTFTVSSPGTYSLSESNRCGDDADSIFISFLEAPDPFTLGPDTVLCPGESIILQAPSTSFDILWQDGSNQVSTLADQPITYSLQLSNDCGIVSDELILTYDTHVPIVDLGPDLYWCEGDSFTLDVSQPFLADYLWSDGSETSFIDISTPGVYSIEISTSCISVSQEINVVPGTDCEIPEVHNEIFIPNIFSPN